jgi:hypothetical protein
MNRRELLTGVAAVAVASAPLVDAVASLSGDTAPLIPMEVFGWLKGNV